MEITLEKIDEIIRRKKVSYQAAKQALEENNGNVVDALASLDQAGPRSSQIGRSIKQLLKRMGEYKVSFEKESEKLVELPLTMVSLFAIVFFPITLGLTILGLITGYSLRVRKDQQSVVQIPALDLRDDVY